MYRVNITHIRKSIVKLGLHSCNIFLCNKKEINYAEY